VSSFRWTRPPTRTWDAARYSQALDDGVERLLNYWAPQIEGSAKQGAPWTDRTGNARQTLAAFAYRKQAHLHALALRQTMDYGVFLETRWQGTYGIVLRTLQGYYGSVWSSVEDLLK